MKKKIKLDVKKLKLNKSIIGRLTEDQTPKVLGGAGPKDSDKCLSLVETCAGTNTVTVH